jgi:hypothetical protein
MGIQMALRIGLASRHIRTKPTASEGTVTSFKSPEALGLEDSFEK